MITRFTSFWRYVRRVLSPTEWFVRWLKLPRDESTQGARGLLLVQIDGLSRKQLEMAIDQGRMPFLKSLLVREHYVCHDLYSGIPSSTPSVQGELFYGVRCAVPAFGYRDHKSGRVTRMISRDACLRVQRKLERQDVGVLNGGSGYCNIYSGGARETHFCASSLGWDEVFTAANPLRLVTFLLWHFGSAVRTLGLVVVEFFLAFGGFLRGTIGGREYLQELMMIPARVVIVILLREWATMGASLDLARGTPVVYLNLLGYDEQAHRRGPNSAFAHWTLKGIDHAIRRLWNAAHRSSKREYDVWVHSDHGQEATIPYEYVTGRRIQEAASAVVSQVLSTQAENAQDACSESQTGCERSGTANRAQWISAGWIAGRLFGENARDDLETVTCKCGARSDRPFILQSPNNERNAA